MISSRLFGDLRLLPVDYHREVARELATFFHSFYRFGSVSNRFDLQSETYVAFLHNVLLSSLCMGVVVFFVLSVIVVRRTVLHIRSSGKASSGLSVVMLCTPGAPLKTELLVASMLTVD